MDSCKSGRVIGLQGLNNYSNEVFMYSNPLVVQKNIISLFIHSFRLYCLLCFPI